MGDNGSSTIYFLLWMGLYSDTKFFFFFFFFTFRNGFSYQITAFQLWVTTVHEQSMISSLIPLGHFVLVSNIWSFDLLGLFNSNLWHKESALERLFVFFLGSTSLLWMGQLNDTIFFFFDLAFQIIFVFDHFFWSMGYGFMNNQSTVSFLLYMFLFKTCEWNYQMTP